jgi:hypothetical protein
MGGGDSSDEDEYVFFGTPIVDEADLRAGQQQRRGGAQLQNADPSAVRALPVHQQVGFYVARVFEQAAFGTRSSARERERGRG